MPVAVKLVVELFATDDVMGVMAIEVSAEAVTVKLALLEVMPLAEAVMTELPCASVLAMPLVLNVATVVLLDTQVTEPETFPVLPSA